MCDIIQSICNDCSWQLRADGGSYSIQTALYRQLYTLGEDIICVCYWPFKGVSEGSGFVVLTQLDRGGTV